MKNNKLNKEYSQQDINSVPGTRNDYYLDEYIKQYSPNNNELELIKQVNIKLSDKKKIKIGKNKKDSIGNMKKILSYTEYVNENNNSYEINKRFSPLVLHDLLNEITAHVKYWFNYDTLKKYELSNIDNKKTNLSIWFNDKNAQPENVLTYKIYLTETEPTGKLDLIDKLKCVITVYNHENIKVKSLDIIIGIDKINNLFFYNEIEKIKNKIVVPPKNNKDISKFRKRETRHLRDGIY